MPKKKNVSPPPEEQSPEMEVPVQEGEAVLPDADNALPAEADLPQEDAPPAEGGEDEAAFGEVLRELGEAAAQEEPPLTLDPEGAPPQDGSGEYSQDDLLLLSEGGGETAPEEYPAEEAPPASRLAANHRNERVLTIDARGEIQTQEERDAIIWHEIQNSHRTRRILTGTLDGVEKLGSGLTLAVVNYKGFRVAIPVKEIMLEHVGKMPTGPDFVSLMDRLHRILNSRLGCEIDFIVKGGGLHHHGRQRGGGL